jgi:hypothetical protein
MGFRIEADKAEDVEVTEEDDEEEAEEEEAAEAK